MMYIVKLILPSALGLALGLYSSGGATDPAGLSNIFFFGAILNILYCGLLFAVDLGSFKTVGFGINLFFRLLVNKNHPGGKKLTDEYVELSNRRMGAAHYWPQGAIGAAFLALSTLFAFL